MEEGMANIFVITQAKTLLKQNIQKTLTKSRGAMAAQKNATQKQKFYDTIIASLIKNFSTDTQQVNPRIGCLVIGSPGFTRENFFNYMRDQAEKRQSAFLKQIVSKSILAHCSTGFKHSLKEILSNTSVNQKIIDLACA